MKQMKLIVTCIILRMGIVIPNAPQGNIPPPPPMPAVVNGKNITEQKSKMTSSSNNNGGLMDQIQIRINRRQERIKKQSRDDKSVSDLAQALHQIKQNSGVGGNQSMKSRPKAPTTPPKRRRPQKPAPKSPDQIAKKDDYVSGKPEEGKNPSPKKAPQKAPQQTGSGSVTENLFSAIRKHRSSQLRNVPESEKSGSGHGKKVKLPDQNINSSSNNFLFDAVKNRRNKQIPKEKFTWNEILNIWQGEEDKLGTIVSENSRLGEALKESKDEYGDALVASLIGLDDKQLEELENEEKANSIARTVEETISKLEKIRDYNRYWEDAFAEEDDNF